MKNFWVTYNLMGNAGATIILSCVAVSKQAVIEDVQEKISTAINNGSTYFIIEDPLYPHSYFVFLDKLVSIEVEKGS